MRKKLIVFGMALILFAGSSMTALAAICPNAPDKVHHFSDCKRAGMGEMKDLGYHQYLYGYDRNDIPIYKNNCKMTQSIEYCSSICFYCGFEQQNGGAHCHAGEVRHSINHN